MSTVSRHVQSTQKEHIHNHKVVAERVVLLQNEGDLVVNKIPLDWVLWRFSTMSMMNDSEESLDHFPAENKEKPAESMVGVFRAESSDLHVAGSGITAKNPPLSLMDRRSGSSMTS